MTSARNVAMPPLKHLFRNSSKQKDDVLKSALSREPDATPPGFESFRLVRAKGMIAKKPQQLKQSHEAGCTHQGAGPANGSATIIFLDPTAKKS